MIQTLFSSSLFLIQTGAEKKKWCRVGSIETLERYDPPKDVSQKVKEEEEKTESVSTTDYHIYI
jgi:hypothetical protein